MYDQGKVLIIYTGGTIGMLPENEAEPSSPLVPAAWERLSKFSVSLDMLGVETDVYPMELIDSSNMTPDYWIELAGVIGNNYNRYEGFVVLHGTDTMTYTATALSFLLENLGKPVILTGAQLSISRPRTDALQNLITAVMLAAPSVFSLQLVPEVCILFHDVLLRGNRSRKVSSVAYTGFSSPNCGVLGRIGTHIELTSELIRELPENPFMVHRSLEDRVAIIDIFPGIKPDILRGIFDSGIRGMVLKTYGAGNAPSHDDFLAAIRYGISERNLVIVNVTQCIEGAVEMDRYATGASLRELGVVGGADMTPEAALVKLQFLLSMDLAPDKLRCELQRNLRGELTPGS